MSLLTLTPTILTAGGASPASQTAALGTLGANTGVLFNNSGRDILVVSVGTTATVATSDIGVTIQGQTVPGVVGSLAASTVYLMGPWPSQYDRQDGTQDVEVDFSSSLAVSVALFRIPGVI